MADTEAPKDPSVLDEARNLLVQGKRSMALEDYQSATDSLEQAVQLFDAYYGVAKIECADAYLEYGLALVALANLEAGSGTDRLMKKAGIEGEEEEEEEGEEDEDEDEEQEDEEGEEKAESEDTGSDKNQTEAGTAGASSNGSGGEEKKENGTSTNGHGEEANKTNGDGGSKSSDSNHEMQMETESEPMPGTSSGAGTSSGVGGDKDEDDVENEEATTIEIAWEVLCLAKRLFMTDESLDGRLKLAETLQKLGEISIEWDNNDNAVSILEECLNIRKAILPAEDRLIAFTYYQLGLAHSFKSETQNANENFQNAINVIEKRIESLNKDLDKAKAGQETMAASAYEREINELKELLPEINMRVDDSKEDSAMSSSEAIKRTRDEIQQEDEEAKKVCLDKSKAADDISHLVKRKAA